MKKVTTNKYTKVIIYLKQLTTSHDIVVKQLDAAFGKKAVLLVETSIAERVPQTGFRDAKSMAFASQAPNCPKDLIKG